MDFFDLVKERRSIRIYEARPFGAEKLQQILDAINRAPSAGNLQAYEIYLVSDAADKQALAAAAGDQDFLAQPPIVIVFCANASRAVGKYGERGTDLYCVQDATIACTYAMLASTALGLSTVWVGAFDEEQVRRAIKAPQAHRPVAILPVGYPAESPLITSRRDVANLVHYVQ